MNTTAQYVHQVKDISQRTEPSYPYDLIVTDSLLYFTAYDKEHDLGLYATDGTQNGIQLLKVLENSVTNLSSHPRIYHQLEEDYLYFDNFNNGVCRSDGTAAGTKDLFPNKSISGFIPFDSAIYFLSDSGLYKIKNDTVSLVKQIISYYYSNGAIIIYNGYIYFSGYDSLSGAELWRSDGTTAGTQLFYDFTPGPYNSLDDFRPILAVQNNTLFITADDSVHGPEIWVSDGTVPGTNRLNLANTIAPKYFERTLSINNKLIINATDSIGTYHLWTSDGTSGGTSLLISDTNYNYGISAKEIIYNGYLYILVQQKPLAIPDLYALLKTDGTAAGTSIVKNNLNKHIVATLTVLNDDFYFIAPDTSNVDHICKADTNLNFQLTYQFDSLYKATTLTITAFKNKLFFNAVHPAADDELWVSDGTAPGTSLLFDINTNGATSISSCACMNSHLYFEAKDETRGTQLWKSNGHLTGTNPFGHFYHTTSTNVIFLNPEIFSLKNKLYFAGPDKTLWNTDGTVTNTKAVNGNINSWMEIHTDGNNIYYRPNLNNEIWKFDPTTTVSNLIYTGSTIYNFFAHNNNVYISRPDTTVAVNPISGSATIINEMPYAFYPLNDSLIYIATTAYTTFDDKLFVTDGTLGGTIQVPNGIDVTSACVFRDTFYFATRSFGGQLHKMTSDTGSTPFFTFAISFKNFTQMAPSANLIYLYAQEFSGIYELWVTDGTNSGTQKLTELPYYHIYNKEKNMVTYNDILYFFKDDGIHGREPWRSDGTIAGTYMLADINPTGSSNAYDYTLCGSNLYFTADDGISGEELYVISLSNSANCFAYYDTEFDSTLNQFTLNIDSVTLSQAIALHWDFGDGTTSTLNNPSHTYASNDIYTVCMTVYTGTGDSCTYCHDIGIDQTGSVILKATGFSIVINGTVDVTSLSVESDISIYPNPSSSIFHIRSAKKIYQCSVFNSSGQFILSSGSENINLTGYPSGIYYCKVIIGDEVHNIKLLKLN